MSKVYVIRHGKTDFNEQGRYLGRTDISLNFNGIQQAKELAGIVKKLNIYVIISSPLKRAIETAEIIKPDGLKIISEPAFIERSLGVYDGLTKDEIRGKYPDLYLKNVTRIFDEAPIGGETIIEVQNRVSAGLDKIEKIYKNKNVLIVTHGFVSRSINKHFNPHISKKDFFDFILQNAEIKKYEFK